MDEYIKIAESTAKEAGELLMKHYGTIQKLEWTTKQHFRTEVDKMSDKLIRKRIIKNFPEHNIYSEEDKAINKNSNFSWVFDSLDGTISYTFGTTDYFSVCIALVEEKTPILGVIYAPKRNELYIGIKGRGAFCNNKKIYTSLEDDINHALVGLDSGKETPNFKRKSLAPYIGKLYSSEGISCAVCSACASVPLALTASGKMHAYMALNLEPWDMAAGVILNRETGAKVTSINGKEWELSDKSILVANPKLHSKLLELIK